MGSLGGVLILTIIKMMQQFPVDVTLDSLTAHPELVLSDHGKQVYHSDVWKKLPDNPERCSACVDVLGKQSFSSGKFYSEVQLKGKTDWTLGVVEESINRKRNIAMSPGYWAVILRDENEYVACDSPPVIHHLKCVPGKVGVFVDYEGGVVSFYDVDAAALIYSFTHKLHPFFNPCLTNYGFNGSL
uniref:B30.2/SPRY domain-containing protein n=1 Tax=Gouania willdenowi TaxID=441366 RepID=A0A8C5E8E8_GOUWI